MTQRALSFGSVAAAYERYRPGYPDELVDQVQAYAGRPVRTALEVGAGTGKATRAFAGRGVAVTATEPDADMLAELRRHVPDTVVPVRAAFEDLPLDRTYDLVFAAASFHWTRADQRWPRVAALLGPGGVFASFGGPLRVADAHVEAAVHAVREPFLGDEEVPSPDGTSTQSVMQWPGTELERSDLFTDVRQSVIERRPVLSAQEYVGHLATISAYLMLSEQDRDVVLGRILEVVPERVRTVADITVHLARLR